LEQAPRSSGSAAPWWRGRGLVIGVPYAWLLLFFLAPFLIVAKYSVSEMGDIRVEDLVTYVDGALKLAVKFSNYVLVATDSLYRNAYLASLKYALVTTLCCLFIGYPFAYFMARARRSLQPLLLMLVMLPFWTSFLLRVYAWKGLLDDGGWVADAIIALHLDHVLLAMGLIETPGQLMHTTFSLLIGMTYTYLPFMILPLYANLSKMDLRLLEAASDLGSPPWRAFLDVTLPLSMPGVIAGSMLVFIPAIGEFVIPTLLGGPDNLMIGRVLWDEFFGNRDWPVASAVAIVFLVLLVGPIAVYQHYSTKELEA